MATEGIGLGQRGVVGAGLGVTDAPRWRCQYLLEKYWKAADGEHVPGDRERIEGEGNLLMNIGANVMWERLITPGASTSATGAALQAFSTVSFIGISTSNTAAAAGQTDLQGSTKWYIGMEAGYPSHSTAASTAARSASYRCVATTSEANIAWNEWAIFNSTSAAKSMLNRKVQSLGTKTSAAQWTFTATLTLS